MSKAEVGRLVEDLKVNETLREGLIAQGGNLTVLVSFGRALGYDITLEDARGYIADKAEQAGRPLSQAELDRIAGSGGASSIVVTSGSDPQVVIVGSVLDQLVVGVAAEATVLVA